MSEYRVKEMFKQIQEGCRNVNDDKGNTSDEGIDITADRLFKSGILSKSIRLSKEKAKAVLKLGDGLVTDTYSLYCMLREKCNKGNKIPLDEYMSFVVMIGIIKEQLDLELGVMGKDYIYYSRMTKGRLRGKNGK